MKKQVKLTKLIKELIDEDGILPQELADRGGILGFSNDSATLDKQIAALEKIKNEIRQGK